MTGLILLACRPTTPSRQGAPWHLVLERAAHALRVVELTGAEAEAWPPAPQTADEACVIFAIGDAAEAAYRLALRTPTALRLVLADGAAPADDVPSALATPITAISSAPRQSLSAAHLGWAHRTSGAFEIRTVPPWRVAPDAFVTGCLRHLHEAGLLTGPGDRGDALALRP